MVEINSNNRRFSNFQRLVTLTLDLVIWHIVVITRCLLPTCQNSCELEILFVVVYTHIQTSVKVHCVISDFTISHYPNPNPNR